MVDENELSKRFGYKNNSNLVIQTSQRNRENVPTGEAESLVGRIKYKMGDLAGKRVKVKKPDKNLRNKKVLNKVVNGNETYNILDIDIVSSNKYRPKTLETKLAYDELLGVLTDILGSQPGNIMDDIVFELLSILKNTEINEEGKRERCRNILSDIKNDDYLEIVDKSRRITDFTPNIDNDFEESEVKNSSEVAVIFDESESEENKSDDYECELDDGSEVIDTESENEDYLYEENNNNDLGVDNESEEFIHIINEKEDKNGMIEDLDTISINELDAYWLQRELFSLCNDAERSLELEQKIISILETEDDQECENSLVVLFNYENFPWIKKLLKNRWNIYFCTILGQASSDNEKEKILERMKNHPQGSAVLDLLSKPSILKDKSSGFLKSIEKFMERNMDDTNDNKTRNRSANLYESGRMYSRRTKGKLLDLELIYQEQSLNTNLNTKVVLPEGTERVEDVDYDSIVIHPTSKKREGKINNISINELPEWCRECFSCVSVTYLNEIQSKVYDIAFKEYDENMLICAPTGSGKTNIAVLCILNIISQYITKQKNKKPVLDVSKFKIVYISPMKALVAEQIESLRMRFKPLGITVNEMTGDTRVSRSLMDLTQIFVTTPEKFDVITRKSTDGLSDRVKLIIFDEIHMLHDTRGAVLEGIVARFKRNYVRMVGLSATLPNYMDIAEFLGVNPLKGVFYFGSEYRPVPLLQTFIGIKAKKGFKKLQLMNDLVLERVLTDITKHQVLVFVHSRKDTLQTAKYIRDKSTDRGKIGSFFHNNNISREIILDEISKIKSNNLKEILPSGIGIHHAGLVRSDRKIIEDLFSDGHIKVLVSTATLAWGVNLPAHTVIIKGTQIYQPEKGEWVELSPLDMLQMIGRGGRPQYDNNGHGIVITDFDNLTYYLSLLNQQLNIESQLIPKLPDFINAEISLGNIKNKNDVIDWIKDTFLYIRIRRNPKLYGLEIDKITDNIKNNLNSKSELDDHDMNEELKDDLIKKSIENYLIKLIEASIDILERCEMIQYDNRDGIIESLLLGRISSHFYLTPETIHDINRQLLPNLSEIQLFRLFSTCKEFKYLIVRNEEKIELEKLVNKVPIPIQGIRTAVNNINGVENMNDNSMMVDLDAYTKANVLLQLYLTGSRWVNAKLTLLSDLHYIVQSAPRIFRAIFNLSLSRRWSKLAKITLKIATVS
ncbi:hypothetical protein FG386_000194 [Cryptosporidium ryanae]|uniref:uncharacterized protein n=1 Tax=Cryptosporidium ryanae TaxID=515981 RepID=UPI00351A39C0|nr:hypothetical protein FG386_000194 [Cryptosporidium ryanae]